MRRRLKAQIVLEKGSEVDGVGGFDLFLSLDGFECERAVVESLRCFSALTCEQIEAYYDDPYNHTCTSVALNVDAACGW